nr:MAG TPA: hypothetical protein [Caudoviricetes sp.]
MATTLKTLGIIKEDSLSWEKEDGKVYKWVAIGGKIIDQMKGEPTFKIKCTAKNLNKALLAEVWDVTEIGDKLAVNSFVSSKKQSVSLAPKVSGAEKVDIPYCSVAATLVFSESEGYNLELEITIISPGVGKPFFTIEKVA